MKVKEVLPKLGIVIRPVREWRTNSSGRGGWVDTDRLEISTNWGQSYAGARGLLESNFESDIEYMDNIGPMALVGFKMRNGQRALFLFNLMGDMYTINRVREHKYVKRYFTIKKAILEGEDLCISSDEFDSWLALKTIGGGRI